MNKKTIFIIALIIILANGFLLWGLRLAKEAKIENPTLLLPEESETNLLTTKLAEIPERYAGSIDGFWWTYEGQTDFCDGFRFASNGETVAYQAMDEEGVWLIVGEKNSDHTEELILTLALMGKIG